MNELVIDKMIHTISPALLCLGMFLNQLEKFGDFFFDNHNLMIFSWITKTGSLCSFILVIYLNYPRLIARIKEKRSAK